MKQKAVVVTTKALHDLYLKHHPLPGFRPTRPSGGMSGRYSSKPRRPSTSPSSISGFAQSTSSSNPNNGPASSFNNAASPSLRAGFESITSWASRPVDLCSSRPNTPPVSQPGSGPSKGSLHHHGLSTSAAYHCRQLHSRHRVRGRCQRTRREKSVDAYPRSPLSLAQ